MLKKCTVIITIFLLGIAIGIGVGVYFNVGNQKKTIKDISAESGQDKPDISKRPELDSTGRNPTFDSTGRIPGIDSIGRIDYPLIDIYFQPKSNYRIEITDFVNTEDRKEVRGKGNDFQYIKGDFSVVTFPTGLGTTPDFYLAVYEDDKCIKDMPCASIELHPKC